MYIDLGQRSNDLPFGMVTMAPRQDASAFDTPKCTDRGMARTAGTRGGWGKISPLHV